MTYTIENIGAILQKVDNCVQQQLALPQQTIQHLLFDSRKIIFPQTALFFALVGHTHDGHHFVMEAYQNGVRNFVLSQTSSTCFALPDINVIVVKNTLLALQQIAAHHRQQFDIPVIGITGSNGKTVVKEWLFQTLRKNYYLVRSPQSYNSQIGVPLSVWQMHDEHQLAIFEAGISQPQEMARLSAVIRPTIGIFTNIGEAHSEGFVDRRQKVWEKLQLFTHCQWFIYRLDYGIISELLPQINPKCQTLTWTLQAELAANAPNTHLFVAQKHTHYTRIYSQHPQTQGIAFDLPFTDEAAIENAIHCCLMMHLLGEKPQQINHELKHLQPIAMRLEQKAAINQCLLINDSYNADLNSLHIALDFLSQQSQNTNRTLILSDILESRKNDSLLYQQVTEQIHQHHITRFIGIGERIFAQQHLFVGINAQFFHTTADFMAANLHFSQENILLKGARYFAFEQIAALLEQKIHTTTLEINLDAIAHNFKVYRQHLPPDTQIMVMVKAFAYGSGAIEIAKILQFNKADYLAVAYPDEGIALRKAGITLPIMVMNPAPTSFASLQKYRLEPEIYSLSHLRAWNNWAKQNAKRSLLPIHLKLDTGMHRLGMEEQDLPELLAFLHEQKHSKIISIFTHLAATDAPEHDQFTQQQLHLFDCMYSQIAEILPYPVARHAFNTAGILRFGQNYPYEWVRLGLGCYGIDVTNTLQHELMTVGTLKTYIAQIKTVSSDETIGYNRKGQIDKVSRIATVNIGYGDGLSRQLSNGIGKMYLHRQLAPIIGNVCMDMTMLNISHITDAKEGDEVIVFGEQLPVQQLAQWQNTIPYEILTNISGRVRRVYFRE